MALFIYLRLRYIKISRIPHFRYYILHVILSITIIRDLLCLIALIVNKLISIRYMTKSWGHHWHSTSWWSLRLQLYMLLNVSIVYLLNIVKVHGDTHLWYRWNLIIYGTCLWHVFIGSTNWTLCMLILLLKMHVNIAQHHFVIADLQLHQIVLLFYLFFNIFKILFILWIVMSMLGYLPLGVNFFFVMATFLYVEINISILS